MLLQENTALKSQPLNLTIVANFKVYYQHFLFHNDECKTASKVSLL